MSPFAASLSDADMADLAAFYAAQRRGRRPAVTDPAQVADGRAARRRCTTAPPATAPASSGRSRSARLAGQDFDYLLSLLRGFKAKTASDLDGTMTMAAQPLTDDEIVSLVHFIATLGD